MVRWPGDPPVRIRPVKRMARGDSSDLSLLSMGGWKVYGAETHRILLRAGVWIIEGLDLARVRPGWYRLICLPLKIRGGDGAPARAVLAGIGHSVRV